ncbi:MAG: formate/nitrite transporter family protein [Salinimicrobium sp.]
MAEEEDFFNETERRQSPSATIVHDTIFKEAESELERSSDALFWSGLAAGLTMGLSMLTEGILHAYLPDADWEPLVSNFGYSVGFLGIILARQQLFTENTLTPMLPLLHRKDWKTFKNVMRLWGVVLLANLLGVFVVALIAAKTTAFEPEVKAAFVELGKKAMEPGFVTIFLRGIFAGWLIALMVWLLPFAETARVWVIIIITWIVGIAELSHVIAGSSETFVLAFSGIMSWGEVLGGYLLPSLIGNVLGGVILVAVLNHAQVVGNDE